MGTLVVFEWMSADGVYDAQSMGEWWEPYDSTSRQQCIIDTYQGVDAFLMGRNTHDLLGPFWSGLPDDAMGGVAGNLTHTPKYVVSSSDLEHFWPHTTRVADSMEAAVRRIKTQHQRIAVIGSGMLVEFLCGCRLVDEFKFLVQPRIMGTGSRFFREGIAATLEVMELAQLDHGVQLAHYRVG